MTVDGERQEEFLKINLRAASASWSSGFSLLWRTSFSRVHAVKGCAARAVRHVGQASRLSPSSRILLANW
jgi:hypothetical protein